MIIIRYTHFVSKIKWFMHRNWFIASSAQNCPIKFSKTPNFTNRNLFSLLFPCLLYIRFHKHKTSTTYANWNSVTLFFEKESCVFSCIQLNEKERTIKKATSRNYMDRNGHKYKKNLYNSIGHCLLIVKKSICICLFSIHFNFLVITLPIDSRKCDHMSFDPVVKQSLHLFHFQLNKKC